MTAEPRGWDALKARIEACPVDGPPDDMRAAFARLAPSGEGGHICHLGGVPCRVFGPPSGTPLVWAHGGGLVFGSATTHGRLAAAIAERIRRPVILPAYRRAPEAPWPAPLDDLVAVLDALDRPVDLGGDSAGGHLALLAAGRRGARVGRLALISPNTDRTGASTTRIRNSARDLMKDDAQDLRLARMVFGNDPAGHADASPLAGDLSGLPAVWITAATNEVLLDDTLLLIAALGRAGVPVQADIRRGLCHLWMLWPDALPDGTVTLDALAAFLDAPG